MSHQALFKTLLSIDDDPRMLDLVRLVFASDFQRILTSTDPQEGLRLAMIYKPDVILLDNDMPGLSGLEVLEQLREMILTHEIPVFMQTGNSEEDTVYSALRHHVAGYLLKPVAPEVLRERIVQFLARRQVADKPQPASKPRHEVTRPVELSPHQIQLLDMHSALNILTVLANEINILYLKDQQPKALEPIREQVRLLQQVLMDDTAAAQQQQSALEQMGADILKGVTAYLQQHPGKPSRELDLDLFQRNLNSLLKMLCLRYQELALRKHDPLKWDYCPAERLRLNLQHVFEAMELNSHGRYQIVYDAADKAPGDYLIDILITAPQRNDCLYLPLVLQEIMRDLSANARKYSQPGSVVHTRLEDNGQRIWLSVKDQGMGIPEAELSAIVDFGQRASNAKDKRSMGGGFGLTKAWYFTQQLGGRLWISSVLNQGTEIQIEIPYPAHYDPDHAPAQPC